MAKLNSKAREAVEMLLSDYSALTQAIGRVGKRDQDFGISVSNEKNDSDFLSVSIDDNVAKAALSEQRDKIAAELAEHGIDVT